MATIPNKANNYGGMSDADIAKLVLEWGRIAPYEPNGYDARCDEAKWKVEHIHHIKGFWAPEPEELVSFEDSYQAHCESYIIWK